MRQNQATLADFLAKGAAGTDAAALTAVVDGTADERAASATLLAALRTDGARSALEAVDPASPVGQLQTSAAALAPGDCELATSYSLPSAACSCNGSGVAYLHCLANILVELQAAVEADIRADSSETSDSSVAGGAEGGQERGRALRPRCSAALFLASSADAPPARSHWPCRRCHTP